MLYYRFWLYSWNSGTNICHICSSIFGRSMWTLKLLQSLFKRSVVMRGPHRNQILTLLKQTSRNLNPPKSQLKFFAPFSFFLEKKLFFLFFPTIGKTNFWCETRAHDRLDCHSWSRRRAAWLLLEWQNSTSKVLKLMALIEKFAIKV